MLHRVLSVAAAFLAAVVLAGCLVTTKTLPAGSGPIADPRLVGTWRGIEDKSGREGDAFLHFLAQGPDKPLRLLWVEGDGYQIYDVATRVIGKHNVFAALPVGSGRNPPEAPSDEEAEYILGFYEVSEKEASFYLLDAKKVGALISSGVVKGTVPASGYDSATVNGSPEELAKFLGSKAAYDARDEEPARIRRLSAVK